MKKEKFNSKLIAPCGMNCGICKAYLSFIHQLKDKNGKRVHYCSGCLIRNKNCFIKRGCKKLSKGEYQYCFECKEMPCKNLDRVDRRYQMRYHISLVKNLKELKKIGMKKFLASQEKKFKCPNCGGIICVHNSKCYDCESIRKVSLY